MEYNAEAADWLSSSLAEPASPFLDDFNIDHTADPNAVWSNDAFILANISSLELGLPIQSESYESHARLTCDPRAVDYDSFPATGDLLPDWDDPFPQATKNLLCDLGDPFSINNRGLFYDENNPFSDANGNLSNGTDSLPESHLVALLRL
jgi:hypothetical protein